MARTPFVRIVEVGPRDGLQNIKETVPLEVKVELINRLNDAGAKYMEPTSIVSPKAIPQLRDSQALLSTASVRSLIQRPNTRYPVLVPNLKGLEIAKKLGVKEVCVFISATEGFSKANINCTVAEGLQRAKEVIEHALQAGIAVRGAVSCIFSDPYDGPTDPGAVLHTVSSLLSYGCYEVLLGDTVGVGCPEDVRRLLTHLKEGGVDIERLAGHFHDTYGQAVANAWAAYEFGIRTFDSAISGLGGCPFAPGAKGNVATEDLVYSFHKAGVQTGLDLAKLSATGEWISNILKRPNNSRAGQAIAQKDISSKKTGEIPPKKLQWHFVERSPNLDILRSGVNVKIVLRRPQNGNALTSDMLTQLKSYIQKASSDQSISRIILTAEGKFFCTGMDLSDKVKANTDGEHEKKKSDHAMLTELFETVSKAPQVTIAAINGPCYAGGIGLVFACDVRIAVETASLTLSEVKLGLCPAIISEYLIREWGSSFTREAMLSARAISMTELKSIGAVHVLASDVADLDKQLDAYLVNLRRAAPIASAMVKKVIDVGWSNPGGKKQRDTIKDVFEGMMKLGSESEIGLGAFRAKTTVDWDALKENHSKPKL